MKTQGRLPRFEKEPMKTQLTTLHKASRTRELTEPVSGRKPVLALLMRLLWAAVLALPVFGAQAAVVFTSLYSFTGGNDGSYPQSALVQGSDNNFYGTTYGGGTGGYGWQGNGTVFKISTNGALTTLHSFTGTNDGASPNGLVLGSDGNFYGTTGGGGTNGAGTVFKITTNGALTTLYAFGSITNASGDPLDGATPYAGLVQGRDGSFYGTTYWGGTNGGYGTVFKISTNGALTSLHSFTYGDGAGPYQGRLVQGRDGNFYGTTWYGGVDNQGTLFKISTNGVLTTLYSFTGTNDGANPEEGLVQGSDGSFYGTTAYSYWDGMGGYGCGTVFKISTNGALTTLHSFTGTNDGASPNGLVQGRDGNFYGTTYGIYPGFGGPDGTVFKISPNGALTILHLFTGGDGATCVAGLVQGSDGCFYGTTLYGGTNGAGTVFWLTIVPEPQLSIIPSGPYVILTWPTNYAGYTLQSTTNLTSPVWTPVSLGPVVIGGQNTVINTISRTQRFYRLSQ
jgi:uncharacterized repeat protein (TIGR03803 family)